jgi:hypothetical protein
VNYLRSALEIGGRYRRKRWWSLSNTDKMPSDFFYENSPCCALIYSMGYFNTSPISTKFIITQAIDMFYKKSYNGSDTKDAIIRGE